MIVEPVENPVPPAPTDPAPTGERVFRTGSRPKAVYVPRKPKTPADNLRQKFRGTKRKTAVLKLYDWRFAMHLRSKVGNAYKSRPLTNALEQAYQEEVLHGDAFEFLRDIRRLKREDVDKYRVLAGKLNDVEREVFLYHLCSQFFMDEVETYQALKKLQGRYVPQFYGCVSLALQPVWQNGEARSMLTVKGILMQHIDGFLLRELPEKAPQEKWQEIVDETIGLVNDLKEFEVINADARPSNFVVRAFSLNGEPHYEVFMIDFNNCLVRGKESKEEFEKLRLEYDEEGSIALAMKDLLGRYSFDLVYERTNGVERKGTECVVDEE
jgi:hypothetical protein